MDQPRLDDLRGLCQVLQNHPTELLGGWNQRGASVQDGWLFCPKCGDHRRMELRVRSFPRTKFIARPEQNWSLEMASKHRLEVVCLSHPLPEQIVPGLLSMACTECRCEFTGIVFRGPEGVEVAVFPEVQGGLTTPNTPAAVAHFLDQARRAQSAGAGSAALAMYRAALEHILAEQQIPGRTCGVRVEALGKLRGAANAATKPTWIHEIDTELLMILKRLGDRSLHPRDDESLSTDPKSNPELLVAVDVCFRWILDLIYEREARNAAVKAELRGVTEKMESPSGKA